MLLELRDLESFNEITETKERVHHYHVPLFLCNVIKRVE